MGARYVRKEMDCPTVKLDKLKVGVLAEYNGSIIMKVWSDGHTFHYYDFTRGSNDSYVVGGHCSKNKCKIIKGDVIIRNSDFDFRNC